MESWLYDMAQEGLFLEKDGISCGRALIIASGILWFLTAILTIYTI